MKFDIHYIFSSKNAKWIIIALVLFFSFLIIVEYASLLFSPVTVAAPLAHDKDLKIVVRKNSLDYILNSSLFGVYVPDDLNAARVKKSMLDVTVVGILLADKIEDSQITIRSASGGEKIYNIGDTVPGDAIIKRIMADGVLVERNGTLESLSLPKNDLTFEPVAKPLNEE